MDGEDEPRIVRPIRKIKPTAALLQHSEKAALPSQTKAINAFRAAEAAKRTSTSTVSAPSAHLPHSESTSLPHSAPSPPSESVPRPSNKRIPPDDVFTFEDNESGEEEREDARMNPSRRKRHKSMEKSLEPVDADGVVIDVDVSITDPGSSREGKTADIDAFFGAVFEQAGANGKVKKHRRSNVCS